MSSGENMKKDFLKYYVIGLFIKHTILALFYTMVAVLIANFITPLCMIVAIFIFLNIYNKNK